MELGVALLVIVIAGIGAAILTGSQRRQREWQRSLVRPPAPQPAPLYAQAAQRTNEEVQAIVEDVMATHLRDFPHASPEQIAILTRDSFLASRIHDQRYYAWAIPETAERLVRTAVLYGGLRRTS